MNQEEKKLFEKIREYCLYQYLRMLNANNFGEMGKARVLLDFTRHFLSLPLDAGYCVSQIEGFKKEFEKIAPQLKETVLNAEEINARLKQSGSNRRLFMGVKKQGFPIVLFGPVSILELGKHSIYVLEKEEARSPSAVLPIMAITTAEGEIVIRREAIELDSFRKKPGNKEEFVKDRVELTAAHEICHRVFSANYPNYDFLALSRILNAVYDKSSLEILNEMLAEWMPEEFGAIGVLPYIAKIAQTDYARATRLFFQNLADYEYEGKIYYGSVLPYLWEDGGVDFRKLSRDVPLKFNYFLRRFEETLEKVKHEIETALFVYKDSTINFIDLARSQKKAFAGQKPDCDPDSLIYKKYFWENMLRYLKTCAAAKFQSVGEILTT